MTISLRRVTLALFFVVAGCLHFLYPDFYLQIMPNYLPAPLFIVYASGTAEVAGGLLLLSERTRVLARYWLILLLIAIFPANFFMYQHAYKFPNIPEVALLIRLPVQCVLILWVLWATSSTSPRQ